MFNLDTFPSELAEKLRQHSSDRTVVVEFVSSRVSDEERDNPQFIRTLITRVVEGALEGLGGPISDIRLKEDTFKKDCAEILQKFIKGPTAELEALFALQSLMHR